MARSIFPFGSKRPDPPTELVARFLMTRRRISIPTRIPNNSKINTTAIMTELVVASDWVETEPAVLFGVAVGVLSLVVVEVEEDVGVGAATSTILVITLTTLVGGGRAGRGTFWTG
jgi:hypothetical protein